MLNRQFYGELNKSNLNQKLFWLKHYWKKVDYWTKYIQMLDIDLQLDIKLVDVGIQVLDVFIAVTVNIFLEVYAF